MPVLGGLGSRVDASGDEEEEEQQASLIWLTQVSQSEKSLKGTTRDLGVRRV